MKREQSLIEYGGGEEQMRGRNQKDFEVEFLLKIDL